ncbi:uncharacterized protein [Lolium perenne]|uniref:uncharacterized protein n=1 Tax=Lolium perenne TaxID=4522 RepID=UPI0021F51FB3|nr:uncharacterized protein LOC127293513 [Lolium perenne]
MKPGDYRRRRLTLAPEIRPSVRSPATSTASSSSGSRFSCLEEKERDSDEDSCSSEVPFEAALDVLEEDRPETGWSTVQRKGRRSDEELVQDFWADIGFPTPASRFWEAKSPSIEGMETNGSSGCRSPGVVEQLRGSSDPGRKVMTRTPSPISQAGVRIRRPPRAGSWRGPVPRGRYSPPPLLGSFLEAALQTAAERSPASGAVSAEATDVAGSEEVQTEDGGPGLHADPGCSLSWRILSRRMGALWIDFRQRRGIDPPYGDLAAAASPSTPSSPPSPSPSSSQHPAPHLPRPSSSSTPSASTSSSDPPSSPITPAFRCAWRQRVRRTFAQVVAASPRPMAGAQPPRGGAPPAAQGGTPRPPPPVLLQHPRPQMHPQLPPQFFPTGPPLGRPILQQPGHPQYGGAAVAAAQLQPASYPTSGYSTQGFAPPPYYNAPVYGTAPPSQQQGFAAAAPVLQGPSGAVGSAAPRQKRKKKKAQPPVGQTVAPQAQFQQQFAPGSQQQLAGFQGQTGYSQPSVPQHPDNVVQYPGQLSAQSQVAIGQGSSVGGQPPVNHPPPVTQVVNNSTQSLVEVATRAKKPVWCWKCASDSHVSKDCKAQHYCHICDKLAHPTVRCPVLKSPRPTAFVAGLGLLDSYFTSLPDSVVKDELEPSLSPIAHVVVTGDVVPADVIAKQMARRYPNKPHWKWEAIPHGANEFMISFPSFEDLDIVDGMQVGVPSFNAQMKVSAWKSKEVPHKLELHQVWVHVEGVPHTVRHFLGLWAVGSLLGKTLDVDLVSLRRRGLVRVFVAMVDSSILVKKKDGSEGPMMSDVVVKLKGYEFRFTREPAGYVAEPDFVPFIWKRKDGDSEDGRGKDIDDAMDTSEPALGPSASTSQQQPVSRTGAAQNGKPPAASTHYAVTPFNPNPQTPRGREIVAAMRVSHPSLERRAPSPSSSNLATLAKVSPSQLQAAVAAATASVLVESGGEEPPLIVRQTRPSSSSAASRCRASVLGRTRPSSARGRSAPPGDRGKDTIVAAGPGQSTGAQIAAQSLGGSHASAPKGRKPSAATSSPLSVGLVSRSPCEEMSAEDRPLAGRGSPLPRVARSMASSPSDGLGVGGFTPPVPSPGAALSPSPTAPGSGGSTPPLPSPRFAAISPPAGIAFKGSTSPIPAPGSAPPTPLVRHGEGGPSSTIPPPKTPLHGQAGTGTPSRRSMRFGVAADGSSSTDEDSLSKAMRRKAEANLDSPGITECYLPVHGFTPFMVVSSAFGAQRPIYGGVCTVGNYGEGLYYPTWVAA